MGGAYRKEDATRPIVPGALFFPRERKMYKGDVRWLQTVQDFFDLGKGPRIVRLAEPE